eukprot:g12304.t1
MNIFRFIGDMSHLGAKLLLLFKLDASRSAAGVSLKTQKLYLLVFLTRYLDLPIRFISLYNSLMKVTYILLTMATIGMMKYRPSLRASYDASLDCGRIWMHGVIPSVVLTLVILQWEENVMRNHRLTPLDVLWLFSEVLEPLALLPQLLLFRGCTDAGRLAWVYVSLLSSYRGFYGLNWIYRAYTEPYYTHHPTLYVAAVVHVGMYVVFLVDRKCRSPLHAPPEEAGVMMEPSSAARKPLLENLRSTDDYFGDDESGSIEASGGGGVTGVDMRPSRGQRQGGEVEDKIEGVLMREREQASLAPGSGGSGSAGSASNGGSEGGMRGSGEIFTV